MPGTECTDKTTKINCVSLCEEIPWALKEQVDPVYPRTVPHDD